MAGRTAHDKKKPVLAGYFSIPIGDHSKCGGIAIRKLPGFGLVIEVLEKAELGWLVPHAWGGAFANLRQAEPQSSFGLNDLLEP